MQLICASLGLFSRAFSLFDKRKLKNREKYQEIFCAVIE